MATEGQAKVYFDTSVFIAALIGDGTEQHHNAARAAIRYAQSGGIQGVYSGLVIAEVFGSGKVRAPQSMPAAEVASRVAKAQAFMRGLDFLSVDLTKRIGDRAGAMALELHLRGADASHLAMAEWSRCAALYSLDEDLLKVGGKVSGLTVSLPVDPMNSEGSLWEQAEESQ